jgi:hypothetical protein
MLWAMASPTPETRASKGEDAIFKSTPTALTQSSTTAFSARSKRTYDKSCWY